MTIVLFDCKNDRISLLLDETNCKLKVLFFKIFGYPFVSNQSINRSK